MLQDRIKMAVPVSEASQWRHKSIARNIDFSP
jgi:hypothetical protein